MNVIAEIGTPNPLIEYIDRPTVKVVIRKGENILILNNGLLPGGGVEEGETELQAIERELEEEIGATVTSIVSIGEVIQYRDYLKRRYVVKGYTADLVAFDKDTNPQNEREAALTSSWHSVDAALALVRDSIRAYDGVEMSDDSVQGKLYNLRTTRELLQRLK